MCVTDCHNMTLAVKVALNPNTTDKSQSTAQLYPIVSSPKVNSLVTTGGGVATRQHDPKIHIPFSAHAPLSHDLSVTKMRPPGQDGAFRRGRQHTPDKHLVPCGHRCRKLQLISGITRWSAGHICWSENEVLF